MLIELMKINYADTPLRVIHMSCSPDTILFYVPPPSGPMTRLSHVHGVVFPSSTMVLLEAHSVKDYYPCNVAELE